MQRITMKWLTTIFGVMIIGLTLLGLVSYLVITNHYQSDAELQLINQASTYTEMLKDNFDPDELKHFVGTEKNPASNVFLFSPSGKLLLASEAVHKAEILQLSENLIRDTSNQKVIQQQVGPNKTKILLARNPIINQGTLLGTIVVTTELTWLENALGSLQMMLLLAGIGAFFVATGLGLLLSRNIVNPILEVGKTIEQLAKGNYGVRIAPINTKDELSLLAKQVNRLAESLDYYHSSRKEFLSNVAHELRTPLTYLKGYASVLHERMLAPEMVGKLTYIIHEQANRLEHLVDDLVTLSRLDEEQIKLKKEKMNIGDLLQKIVREMTPHGEKLGVKFTVKTPSPLYLKIDPQRFHQIIINLIDNALRYSKEEGTVTIIAAKKSKWTMIQVIDEGIGMSTDQLDRIWERFYRVEKSRSRHTGGSGLGLSIVQNLVHLHGGKIKVESGLDWGTTFTIHFPNHDDLKSKSEVG